MLTKTCSKCGITKPSRWHKGQICSNCYMLSRQLQCVECNSTQTQRWYKGPICSNCYTKVGYRKKRFQKHEPCIKCGKTESSVWRKGMCRSCSAKVDRSKPKSIEQAYTIFIRYTRNVKKFCDITLEQYTELHNKKCYYCDGDILHQFGGMDRIDNNIGYTYNNVLPCCGTCNKIRGDRLTVDEMKYVMEKLIEYRKNKK